MKNTFRLPHCDKPLSALSWALFCVWFAGALLFLTSTAIVLQICGLGVAISGAFAMFWFRDGYDLYRWMAGCLVLQFLSFGTTTQLENFVAGLGTFTVGSIAAGVLSKNSKSS